MRCAIVCVLSLCFLLVPALAQGDPWFGWDESALEDQFVDGGFDEEDHIAMSLGGHVGGADLHGQSWVSLVGFSRELASGRNDLGGILVVGLALDRFAAAPVRRLADPARESPALAPPSSPALPEQTTQPPGVLSLAPTLARQSVAATLRASGL